jgi:hypothetical protein
MTPPSSEAATVAATTITAQREDYRVGRTEAVYSRRWLGSADGVVAVTA